MTGAVLGLLGSASTAGTSRAQAAPHRPVARARPAPKRIRLPANPRVYFFGDSWINGTSADAGRGFPTVVGETLGWTVELGPDNSGAGFVHTFDPAHLLLPERAKLLPPIDADLIVLAAGLNDGPGPLTHFRGRMTRTVRTLRARAGGVPLVVVGPVFPDGTVPERLALIDRLEAAVAKRLRLHYVSPTRERWFTPTNAGGLIDPGTFHPNTAGHAYYAGRLAADLQRFVTTRVPEPSASGGATAPFPASTSVSTS